MEKMFCYQCQETVPNKGCTKIGVCGKTAQTANLQDLLIYVLKGISKLTLKVLNANVKHVNNDEFISTSLFMTITNANFDDEMIITQIEKGLSIRNELKSICRENNIYFCGCDDVNFEVNSREELIEKANSNEVRITSTEDEDIRSLRELITYGLKGLAAYVHHAANLGYSNQDINNFFYKALVKVSVNTQTVDDLVALTLETGDYGVKGMALLDEANTSKYGNPEITEVNVGVRNNPAILISGHDLSDMEELLKQTEGTGVDVYTHSEMLPANYYPAFKKYEHFVGNYGNAWWKQREEFESFNGPILFTTNCIVPPRGEVTKRIFTTGATGYPGCTHIDEINGKKDFTQIIELAKKLPSPTEIETGTIIGGFAHNQVMQLADKVVDAVKSGAIKNFVVMAGCDGRHDSRNYYTDFAKALPQDAVILTAGCAKYKYNKLNLGDIGGIPRVLDAGQCNDSYSLAVIALKLKEVFNLNDINDLPIVYNIAWYEQKAVIVLLALLKLGVKNIHLGPTLPTFVSPNVLNVLVSSFNIGTITTVEEDIKNFLK